MAAPSSAADAAMPVAGDLAINTDSHQVYRSGKAIDLTQREYELLTFLASHPNKVYSRVDLMEQVWNYGYVGDDVRTCLLYTSPPGWTESPRPFSACRSSGSGAPGKTTWSIPPACSPWPGPWLPTLRAASSSSWWLRRPIWTGSMPLSVR